MTLPDQNYAEAFRLKRKLHGHHRACYVAYPTKGVTKHSTINRYGGTSTLKKLIHEATLKKLNVAMAVNRTKGSDRKAKSILKSTVIVLDADGNVRLKTLLGLPLPPALIVRTSPHHYHAYWPVKDCTPAHYTHAVRELARKLGTDESVADPSRVLRLPGTLNFKQDKPYMAKIVHSDDEVSPVSVSRFLRKMGLPAFSATSAQDKAQTDLAAPMPTTQGNESTSQNFQARTLAEVIEALERISAENRDTWLHVGYAVHSAFPGGDGLQAWTKWSKTAPDKFDAKEQERVWKQMRQNGGIGLGTIFQLAKQAPGSEVEVLQATSDHDLAKVFVTSLPQPVKYDAENKRWYLFADRWKRDAIGCEKLALAFIESEQTIARSVGNHDAARRFASLKAANGPQNLLNAARLVEGVAFDPECMDKDPLLLGVQNGVVDLTTGQLRQGRPDDWVSMSATVTVDPAAKAPMFDQFLNEVLGADKEYKEYLQRALGSILVGHTQDQKFFILLGSGGNGKGTLMHLMRDLLGSYATSIAPSVLTKAYASNPNSASPALMALRGVRLICCDELAGFKLEDAFVKGLTGGDAISARSNYGEQQSFLPQGKLFLSANDMPQVAFHDHAMWRRIVVLPFALRVPESEVRADLGDRLWEERAGVLNWLLKGASAYRQKGLGTCAAIEKEDRRVRGEADSVGDWFRSTFTVDAKSKSFRLTTAMLGEYRLHCKDHGRTPVALKAFVSRLVALGLTHKKRSKGNGFVGASPKK